MPSPAQCGHAPYGLLKEKALGASSSMEIPQFGQARLAEKSISRSPGPISARSTPPESASAVSSESFSRERMSSRRISLSTTTSMVCFFVLASGGTSARS